MESIVYFDAEIGVEDHKIRDIGALRDGETFHSASVNDFYAFAADARYLCGHNIVHHDLKYLSPLLPTPLQAAPIDTLYLSPLLFPRRPYHALLKDDKLQSDELNNPVNDSEKARRLFLDEVNAFAALPEGRKRIYCALLREKEEFRGFFQYVGFSAVPPDLPFLIRTLFRGKLCENADIPALIEHSPVELAYVLALIGANDEYSITPPWVLKTFPVVGNALKLLRNTPCRKGCAYCRKALDIHKALLETFNFKEFRTYNGEPLQENAARAAVDGKSLLAVFPTGGGKSVTFQLPALMAGKSAHALTVVISPLQSLMKDQVDNLSERGIVDAVTINGALSPVERAEAVERVASGMASLLYIAPESLRSRTLETLLLSRPVARFVIDEAHCFSAWGQDFRVDYLFIGDFIRELQRKKADNAVIPVSCFTATAKQKVISDIRDYFKRKLDLDLELYASAADRENLRYFVLHQETEEEKYATLRNLIEQKQCPTIVYVSRTRRARELAERLSRDGIPALPYHGKLDATEKIANQEAFIRNEARVIVATSAFGMGVDKKDVGLVIHYDISDSLENYIQEAGRAGRDPESEAECYVLYQDGDLDKHFLLLNQNKVSISEIQRVWKAIKDLTLRRNTAFCSPLELARQSGWDDSPSSDMEIRIKTAVAALENAGYIKRGRNVPHVYATSITVENMTEATERIDRSEAFSGERRLTAKRIMSSLISSRSIAQAGNDDAESRVDYLADILGLTREDVIYTVNLMRREGLLADNLDMSAYILREDTENKSLGILRRFGKLEGFLLSQFGDGGECDLNLKQCNEDAQAAGIAGASVRNIRTVLYYMTIKGLIRKEEIAYKNAAHIAVNFTPRQLEEKLGFRLALCEFIIGKLFERAQREIQPENGSDTASVLFSLVGLYNAWRESPEAQTMPEATLKDVEDALLYLSKTGALRLEGGFLVLYNSMELKRLVRDNRRRYKAEDYWMLDEYYRQKIQQIHIVGEYANLMVRDYDAALRFVRDYFQMDFRKFIRTYFKGERAAEINRNISPEKYRQLFGELSEVQSQIIHDTDSKYIVVAAGPGSGKTRTLVHKLASLLMLEDVKHEQLLMVTFSRSAATEFKKRLVALVGNAANFVEIKTFHSYCFDLLGKIGNLTEVDNVVRDAARLIEAGEVEPGKILKAVLVIDEAQDMDANEYALVQALMRANDEMRVIAVGDDDQNIYAFRGSDSKYLRALIEEHGAVKYELLENYRSCANIVNFANRFVTKLRDRMKSNPTAAVREGKGVVRLVRHSGSHMETAVADEIAADDTSGSICVLTNTNDEALQMTGLLLQRGIRARLIQSNDEFKLSNLAEVRYFLKRIDGGLKSPVIDRELWENAKARLSEKYAESACLENCLTMLADFEKTYPVRYRTDLEEFIRESRYEDFYGDAGQIVTVSTIHKAKGREFDAVYMLLNRVTARDDEKLRTLYVGMTRAKDALHIHYNNDLFDGFSGEGIERTEDAVSYPEPDEIALRLTMNDVVLNFCKDKKARILQFHSGMELALDVPYLYGVLKGRRVNVVKFSRKFQEKLGRLQSLGYEPYAADVRFIVAWRNPQEMEEETAVVLPNLRLRK